MWVFLVFWFVRLFSSGMGLALSWCKSRIADIDTVRLHHPSLLSEVATMPLGMTQALLGEFVYLVELFRGSWASLALALALGEFAFMQLGMTQALFGEFFQVGWA